MTSRRHNLVTKLLSGWLSLWLLVPALPVIAQDDDDGGNPGGRPRNAAEATLNLNFKNAPIQLLMNEYSKKTGRTILEAPGLAKSNVTLESQTGLTLQEYLQAIETVLAMNGIAMITEGDKFLRAIPIGQSRQEGTLAIRTDQDGKTLNATDQVTSQLIVLKHITIQEAQPAIDALKHPFSQVHLFENTQSVLITDTAANIRRIMEVVGYIDQPVEMREEPIIIRIKHSKASEIQQKLAEIIADSQVDAQKTAPRAKESGAPGVESSAPTIPGVIRAGGDAPATGAPSPTHEQTPSQAAEQIERGAIVGRVRMISDDRTNILILIMRKENVPFFENIINALDVETAPDVMVNLVRLEYADAETVASTLNTLIGGAVQQTEATKPAAEGQAAEGATTLSEYAKQVETPAVTPTAEQKSKLGELKSENIKILADKRTNAILLMASKADFTALKEIIQSMDIMLSQVAINVVIFAVSLRDTQESGIDWMQKTLVAYSEDGGSKDATLAFSGVLGGGKERSTFVDPLGATADTSLYGQSGNMAYFFSFLDLNLDAVVRFVSSQGDTRVLSSPKIVTTDNKAATINVTREKYFYKGLKPVTASNGSVDYTEDVELKTIGTKLTVTPHINEKKMVVMEIDQALESEGENQPIGDSSWPTINSSTFTAEVAVRSGETIVLGGMVGTTEDKQEQKVPILGDIPFLGNLFKYKKDDESRTEIVAFITPHVLDTPEQIAQATRETAETISARGLWPNGWVNSSMARHLGESAGGRGDRAYMRADRRTYRDDMVPADTNAPMTDLSTPAPVDPEVKAFIENQEERTQSAP